MNLSNCRIALHICSDPGAMGRLPPLLFLSSLLVFSLPPPTTSAAPSGTANPALVAYLDGLDGLTQGRLAEAVAVFSRTLEAAGSLPSGTA